MSTLAHTQGHIDDKVTFGFWVYLMSDCVLFATLFATFAVLRGATLGGPTSAELFSLPFVLVETIILLTSSFTVGLAVYFAAKSDKSQRSRPLGQALHSLRVVWLRKSMKFFGSASTLPLPN